MMRNAFLISYFLFVATAYGESYLEIGRQTPFIQEMRKFFREKDGLRENDVKEIIYLPSMGIYILTNSGIVQKYQESQWQIIENLPFIPQGITGVRNELYLFNQEKIARLDVVTNTFVEIPFTSSNKIKFIKALEKLGSINLYITTPHTVILYNILDQSTKELPEVQAEILSIAVNPETAIYIGTTEGIYCLTKEGTSWELLLPGNEIQRWAPRHIYALTFDNDGNLWFGSKEGVGKLSNENWTLFTGKDGLPWNEFLSAYPGESGDVVWFATTRGAIRHEKGKFYYRFSHRWLLSDWVNSIAVEPNGNTWIATPGGISLIERKPMTLEEKSDYFINQVETRHNRDGYVAECRLREPFNPDSWLPDISDNDGLYTSMYGSAHAFRYAVTKDARSKEIAKRSFFACKRLVDITGLGFPARVIIPKDWYQPVNEIFTPEKDMEQQKNDPLWKVISPRFVPTVDGQYLWKCDTSSDELAGHYFFYGIYFDLVAEKDEEKQPVREVVKTITDHLIRNNYCLVDHDGKPTRWGFFSPEMLHSLKGWEQRGLNSMMMLSFLRVAHHITGDPVYMEKFNELCSKYFYHINSMQSKMYYPPDFVVPWDNNLCLMSWFGLYRYETDPEKLLMWRIAIEHAWQHAHRLRNPFWHYLYLACAKEFERHLAENRFSDLYPDVPGLVPMILRDYGTPKDLARTHAIETLVRTPLDLISYCMDNTKRLDVIIDPESPQGRIRGWHIDGFALPIEERPHVRHDNDPFTLNSCSGPDGYSEHEGTFFLLPYWLGVYYGFIQ